MSSVRIIDSLPAPLRHTIELIILIGSIGGGLTFLASLFSHIADLTLWRDAWSALTRWSIAWPDLPRAALEAIGYGAHWIVSLYRAIAYPIFEAMLSWLPWRIDTQYFDALFVIGFGFFGVIRIYAIAQQRNLVLPQHLGAAIASSGAYAPAVALNGIGLYLLAGLFNRLIDADEALTQWIDRPSTRMWYFSPLKKARIEVVKVLKLVIRLLLRPVLGSGLAVTLLVGAASLPLLMLFAADAAYVSFSTVP